MHEVSPICSIHALDPHELSDPAVAFWTVWDDGSLVGCGALKMLDATHGEIKSMHTVTEARGKGVGAAMLRHILKMAKDRKLQRVSLETGAQPAFEPARALYTKFGFSECSPFGAYEDDPNSVFMTLELA